MVCLFVCDLGDYNFVSVVVCVDTQNVGSFGCVRECVRAELFGGVCQSGRDVLVRVYNNSI